MQVAPIPQLDEHTVEIDAGVPVVWTTLVETLDTGFSGAGGATFARAVGCADRTASGPRPLTEGSTVPGFHVSSVDAERELVLEGSHRFSTYALIFRLDEIGPGRTRLRAESRAVFPGVPGRIYRLLVISTGGHVAAVRRLLAGVERQAERRAT